MRNRKNLRVVIAVVYCLILLGLLFLQAAFAAGLQGVIANLLAIVLAVVSFFLGKLYVSIEPEKEKTVREDCVQKQALNPEEVRIQIFAYFAASGLSAREQEVAWLIYRGYSNLQIAEELYISETTVKKHGSHIYEKLAVSGRKLLKEKIREELHL